MTSEFAIAVHTLVFLNHKGECQSSERIAENVCTNPVIIRRILSKLKKAHLVETKEGIDGGCSISKAPQDITLAEILNSIKEDPISVSKRTGNIDMQCQIASGMAAIMDGIYAEMNKGAIERLQNITIKDINGIIFHENGGRK